METKSSKEIETNELIPSKLPSAKNKLIGISLSNLQANKLSIIIKQYKCKQNI